MFDKTPATEKFPNLHPHGALNQANTVYIYICENWQYYVLSIMVILIQSILITHTNNCSLIASIHFSLFASAVYCCLLLLHHCYCSLSFSTESLLFCFFTIIVAFCSIFQHCIIANVFWSLSLHFYCWLLSIASRDIHNLSHVYLWLHHSLPFFIGESLLFIVFYRSVIYSQILQLFYCLYTVEHTMLASVYI